MGPSGSGKTTLLDVLSGRKTVRRLCAWSAAAVLVPDCAATPLHARWLERETVPRATGLTQQQFAEQYERCGRGRQ